MSAGPPTIRVGGPGGLSSLPGCRSSLITSQAITSFGSPGLNQILGGGVPVGTVLIFEEKPVSLHSKRFLHVFAAEGLALGHRVAVATPPDSTVSADFIALIPSRDVQDTAEQGEALRAADREGAGDAGPDGLKIAWRYESTPKISSTMGLTSGAEQEYDLGKRLLPEKAGKIKTFHFEKSKKSKKSEKSEKLLKSEKSPHIDLMNWIIQESNSSGPKNVLRVVLPCIDSPLWGFQNTTEFSQFLFQLRSLVRNSNIAVAMTISEELHDEAELFRVRRQADAYISVETLGGEGGGGGGEGGGGGRGEGGGGGRGAGVGGGESAMLRQFQSVCRVQKGYSVNALRPPQLTDYEFGLKIKKRRIAFERLHLPPALQETTGDSQHHAPLTLNLNVNCQTTGKKEFDF